MDKLDDEMINNIRNMSIHLHLLLSVANSGNTRIHLHLLLSVVNSGNTRIHLHLLLSVANSGNTRNEDKMHIIIAYNKVVENLKLFIDTILVST